MGRSMITKVYTKYDEPFKEIHEVFIGDIVAKPIDECLLPEVMCDERTYVAIGERVGLEGVKFVTYGNEDEKER